MSTNLVVTGLPGDATFPKLLNSFRILFKKINVKQFWIRELCDDGHLKQMTVELTNNANARKARNFLNDTPFTHRMVEFPLQAYIPEESMEFVNENDYEDWGRKRRPKRTRVRSRSPGCSPASQASKLDMEIELLRKQRQVIEEERRLLMEQKKLEMIKEYGPSISREFENFEDYEPPRKRRQPEPVPKRPRLKSPPVAKIPKIPKSHPSLPLFFQPCKKLISQMKPIIEKDTTPEEIEILIKLIRAAIRKDLAIALEDKEYMKHGEIIKLYRQRHPKEEDEAFVAKILANIRASYLIDANTTVKGEKDTPNETDVTKHSENHVNDKEDQVAGNETALQEHKKGDKKTDVGTVSETAVSQQHTTVGSSAIVKPEVEYDFTADITTETEVVGKEKEAELLKDGETEADEVEGQ